MNNGQREIAILGIGTAVPPHRLEQDEMVNRLSDALAGQDKAARWARRIFRQCGVATRYTCEPNLLEPVPHCKYFPMGAGTHAVPTTAERMEVYRREAVPLGVTAAREALAESGVKMADITHVIAVSCTGLFLPGLDVALMRELGLAADVERLPLTFLGCAAGLAAIRLSKQIAEGDPRAKVLIVSVELCTIHVQPSHEREDLFAAAFFGDGAAACIVGGTSAHSRPGRGFVLGHSRTVVFPDTGSDMRWNVGNNGFTLYLSPKIPRQIGEHIPPEIERLMGGDPMPEAWAIHPGGRGIIDAVQRTHKLSDAQTRASRSVLRRYGNLSSATIFFVLKELSEEIASGDSERKEGIALAFGPGLSAELVRMTHASSAPTRGETLHA